MTTMKYNAFVGSYREGTRFETAFLKDEISDDRGALLFQKDPNQFLGYRRKNQALRRKSWNFAISTRKVWGE
jgi:hypothetical protein